MSRTPFGRQRALALVLLCLATACGCQQGRQRSNIVRRAIEAPEPPTPVPPGVTLCDAIAGSGLRPQRNLLALSSGGLFGAYSTGFLAGWTGTGTRPEFDTVTGVSVGSLIAPYAFLGPEYDGIAMSLSTGVRAEDVFRIRAWVTIPFKDAVASSTPLKKLIESQITPSILARIAEEHAKGRRLYVGTTNLTTRRLVVWDMGAIASRPDGAKLFRDVLMASCAVPGMFPPVSFTVPGPDGQPVTELHVDGGVTSQVFMPSTVFRSAVGNGGNGVVLPGANGNLFVIVAGKLYPDASPVRPRVLPILGATTESAMYAHCRVELSNLHGQAQLSGMRFHRASLRPEVTVNAETLLSIDPAEMQKLYREGEQDGLAGPAWVFTPPDLCDTPPIYVQDSARRRR